MRSRYGFGVEALSYADGGNVFSSPTLTGLTYSAGGAISHASDGAYQTDAAGRTTASPSTRGTRTSSPNNPIAFADPSGCNGWDVLAVIGVAIVVAAPVAVSVLTGAGVITTPFLVSIQREPAAGARAWTGE